ncbi:MAG: STAS domain-containing protein [Melioribacteraceae bacterium]|nr:STAS domain-containing protein [Melioribacteraceae bacterium]
MPIISENINDVSIILADIKRATVINAEDFKNIVQFELNDGNTKFIFDLKTCEFIDSTFLAAIVTSYKRIVENKGQLKIVGFKPAVRSMFELTSLSKIFDIYDNEQKALMSFK